MSFIVILSSFKLECEILLILMKHLVKAVQIIWARKVNHPWKPVYHNNDQNTHFCCGQEFKARTVSESFFTFLFIYSTFSKCLRGSACAGGGDTKMNQTWSLTSLNACFGSFFPTPHSEFHNLVFCIFHCDVAKFNSNLELCISDKFLPRDSLDVISVFFRLSVRLQNHGVWLQNRFLHICLCASTT